MNTRSIVVSAAPFLVLILLSHSAVSTTARTAAAKKQPAKTRQSQKDCADCGNEAARKTTKASTRKRTKLARNVPCHPKNYVDPKIAKNYNAAMRDMKRAGIKPRVTSAWRSSATQARLYRCSMSTRCRRSNPGLYRALPAGTSIHEAGFAVDIAGVATGPRGGKQVTPRGRRIVSIMKKNGFNWRYGLKDPVHFEADPKKHGYRSVKAAITHTQTTCQIRLAKSKGQKRSASKVAVNGVTPKPRLAADTAKPRQRAVKLRA